MISGSLGDLPPATTRVDCSGERHTIRWAAGELSAPDHGDPEGERALAALGGTSCACLDILGAWARHREGLRLLTAISRGPGDLIQSEGFGAPPGLRRAKKSGRAVGRPGVATATRSGWVASAPLSGLSPAGARGQFAGTPDSPEEEIALLAGLGRDVTVRMVATITETLLQQPSTGALYGPAVRPALEASLFGRASDALRMWLGAPDVEVELEVTDQPDDWTLTGDVDSSLRLLLPLEWVTEVWGRDLSVVAGRFSLGVVESSGSRITLSTVASDLGPPKLLTIGTP
jgi:hypothetical protein